MHDFDEHFIILPDGRLEKANGRIPEDCPVEAIVFPRVSADLVVQAKYEEARLAGTHHALSCALAYRGDEFGDFAFSGEQLSALGVELAKLDELQLYSVIVMGRKQFHRYIDRRLAGESHNISLMIACKSFPGIKSDSIFNEGKFSGESQSGCSAHELWMRKDAEKKGFSTNGLWYCAGLASFPNDPKAWVGGRGDVERVCRDKNFTILDGYVSHKGHEVAPKPDIEIDHMLVHREAADIVATHPGSKYEDVYERVHEVRTGKVDNNPLVVHEQTRDF